MKDQRQADREFGRQEQCLSVQVESNMPVGSEFGAQQIPDIAAIAVDPRDQIVSCRQCADAMVEAVRVLGIEVRVGIHAGEVEVRGADVAGMAVHIAARVAALAGPSEVLVSSTMRDIVTGSRRTFAERGERELKGVPGQWRLYALAREHAVVSR